MGPVRRSRGLVDGSRAGDARGDPVDLRVALDADRAWAFVTGSAARAMLSGLDPAAFGRVRERYLDALAADGVDAFHIRALIGVARQ